MPEKVKVPAIRFKGFTDAWEQRKLHDIADVRDGTHDSPKYISQGHPFITSKNVGGGYINYDAVQYISDSDFVEINKRSKVDKNDILMGMIGTIGNIALIRENPDFAIKNVALIKDTKVVNYLYLYHYLQSSNVMKQLSSGMDGGTQKFIALNKIRNLNILLPNDDEQQVVGQFLENLDNLITLHQRKLLKLKNIKKAMLEKMFPKNGNNVPEIRFAGFTDAWEQRRFDMMFERISNNSLSRANLNYKTGNIKSIHYGDILIKYGAIIDCRKDEIPFITRGAISDYEHQLLRDGDVLIADAAEDETVGKTSEIVGVSNTPVVSGLHTIACRPKIEMQSKYLGYYMNSPLYRKQLWPLMQGIKVLSLSWANLARTTIYYPFTEQEQIQIGKLFSDLDTLITLHQRKYEKLQNIKKACIEKMFI